MTAGGLMRLAGELLPRSFQVAGCRYRLARADEIVIGLPADRAGAAGHGAVDVEDYRASAALSLHDSATAAFMLLMVRSDDLVDGEVARVELRALTDAMWIPAFKAAMARVVEHA